MAWQDQCLLHFLLLSNISLYGCRRPLPADRCLDCFLEACLSPCPGRSDSCPQSPEAPRGAQREGRKRLLGMALGWRGWGGGVTTLIKTHSVLICLTEWEPHTFSFAKRMKCLKIIDLHKPASTHTPLATGHPSWLESSATGLSCLS